MQFPEKLLSRDLLDRATLRGNEYAWNLDDIPCVIEAAKTAAIVNIGGQLQFRFPGGGTCECYWVQVDTYQTVSSDLPWGERVSRTAEAALSDFGKLKAEFDFIAEGRKAFEKYFDEFETQGGDPSDAMCFVWYVETQAEEAG